LSSGKTLLNLASANFLGYITNEDIKVKLKDNFKNDSFARALGLLIAQ